VGKKTSAPWARPPILADLTSSWVGFWLMAGKPDPQSSDFLATVGRTKVFLMATHGAAADSEHARKAMEHAKSLAAPAQVAGTFNCQGEVSPAFLEKAAQKDPQPPWIGDAPAAAGHPDHSDIDRLAQALKSSLPQFVA
jgi:hypothetical protein